MTWVFTSNYLQLMQMGQFHFRSHYTAQVTTIHYLSELEEFREMLSSIKQIFVISYVIQLHPTDSKILENFRKNFLLVNLHQIAMKIFCDYYRIKLHQVQFVS